jgi:hypothetical protein
LRNTVPTVRVMGAWRPSGPGGTGTVYQPSARCSVTSAVSVRRGRSLPSASPARKAAEFGGRVPYRLLDYTDLRVGDTASDSAKSVWPILVEVVPDGTFACHEHGWGYPGAPGSCEHIARARTFALQALATAIYSKKYGGSAG